MDYERKVKLEGRKIEITRRKVIRKEKNEGERTKRREKGII